MNALLMGYYGGRNLGDEMMLFCLQRWLGAQNVELTVLTEAAGDVERRHGIAAVENVPLMGEWAWRDAWLRGKARRVLAAIFRHDALIIGGGDLIRDDGGWKPFFFAFEKIVVALLLRRKVYLVNIGIGVPTTRYGRFLLKRVLPRCTRIIARDQRTFDLCHELGAGRITEYLPDIVLSLPQLLDCDTGEPPSPRPYVVVCLRTEAHAFKQFAWTEGCVRTLASGLDRLVDDHDLDVVFLPFQGLVGAADDNRIHQEVASRMRHGERITIRPWTDSLTNVSQVVRGAACVIAMRLHAAVLACALDRPCVLIPYDHKVGEFGRQMGLQHEITAETLENPMALARVLEAGLASAPARRIPARSHLWTTLTLVGPAIEPMPISCT